MSALTVLATTPAAGCPTMSAAGAAFRRIAAACALAVLTATGAAAETCGEGSVRVAGTCKPVAEVAGQVRSILVRGMSELDLKSVIASVRIGDTPILTEAWGESMTGVPATVDMHFRNGAVAIAYLSTVLLQMVDARQLGLDDRLAKWFPELPGADEITLRMLINSTSGYADYVNLDILPLYEDPFRQWTPRELIDLGVAQPMRCDPGTCFAYAHTNFVILGEVLARAAGKPVEVLIREGILEPLGLANTRSETTAAIQAPVLHAFTAERGVYEDSTYWNPSWTLAAGAIMTTSIADMLASGIAIGSGALLTPELSTAQLALAVPVMPGFSEDFHFGLGVIRLSGWVAQTPSFAGYAAAMAYLPAGRIALAVTATMNEATPDSPRPTDVLFGRIARYLAPDNVPRISR